LPLKREQSADVNDKVASIIARVREEGDAALIDLTKTYDGVDLRRCGHQDYAGRACRRPLIGRTPRPSPR
jgi:histidinol dehydrogenase